MNSDFKTQGYQVVRGVLSGAEIGRVDAAFTRLMEGTLASTGPVKETNILVSSFVELDADLRWLLDDARIMDLVSSALGSPCVFYGGSSGHLFAGNTRWHFDGGKVGWAPLTMALYLDPLEEGTGCLSVLPGSHREELHSQTRRRVDVGLLDVHSPRWSRRTPLPSNPGDVVLFDHAVYHSSWGGRRGRRMLSISFAPTPGDQGQRDTLMKLASGRKPWKQGYRLYSEALLREAGEPCRSAIGPLIEAGFVDGSRPPFPEDLEFHIHRPEKAAAY